MAQSFASNPRSQELRNQSYRQLRAGAVRQRFGPGGIDFYVHDEGNLSPIARTVTRSRVEHAFSSSSVPLAHLNGLQFVGVSREGVSEAPYAEALYHAGHRAMSLSHNVNWTDPGHAAYSRKSVVHELGHHVETVTHGGFSDLGRREAVAENYADRHSPGATSMYDRLADAHAPGMFRDRADPSGEIHRLSYIGTRASGAQPHDIGAGWGR